VFFDEVREGVCTTLVRLDRRELLELLELLEREDERLFASCTAWVAQCACAANGLTVASTAEGTLAGTPAGAEVVKQKL
jgi:hypothetical protein